MADWTMKSGDRLPSIRATLSSNGAPVDLTLASGVSFIMRMIGASLPTVNTPAVVVDPASGLVRYDWAINDTSVPGQYQAEWEVTWPDGKLQTFPTLTYHSVDILDDLDSD